MWVMKLDYLECHKLIDSLQILALSYKLQNLISKKLSVQSLSSCWFFRMLIFWIFFTYKITSSKKFLGLVTHFFKIIFGMDILIFDFWMYKKLG